MALCGIIFQILVATSEAGVAKQDMLGCMVRKLDLFESAPEPLVRPASRSRL